MLDWFKSRLIVVRIIFFVPIPVILAIWAWGIPAVVISFILTVFFATAVTAFESKDIFNIWCFCASTSSIVALYYIASTNPAALPGAPYLEGFLYPLLYLITAIVLFPKIKE
ncbi:TPA: hypothetical protein DCP77_04065 [Candidatus Collierbacteria bacterium]|nr:MAG: hypothetical protein UV30_C0017G0014 [Candidatus Collierbacteria bacterium GW2011_GWF1_42_50]KKS62380.1 MAG: hypothetical protein UV28_C0011G0013 [Candidatus Collierbacteria bacterium GW2011_GWE2_42_48]KKS66724.1 MAG: hypothetical protein UV37_C0017G0017 [Candidatus Collierbacteria bacterium GW2011_GWA1_42_60]HAI22785.1 hypothetical protein [Candidatus Collierbacteria bacterium]HAN22920.1 hypothetical protein [Candidatus Collierbacteria bacterium]